MMAILELLCGIAIFLLALYYYCYTSKLDFWKKRGIPGPKATPFFDMLRDVIFGKEVHVKYMKEIYDIYKGAPLVGIFNGSTPILFINDPALIKDVFITDSAIFADRGKPSSKKGDPTTLDMLRLEGEISRHIRTKISPFFTSSKIKNIFPLLLQRSRIFKEQLDKMSQGKPINCNDILRRHNADCSALYMYGYDIKTVENGSNEIMHYATEWSRASWKNKMKEFLMENATRLYDNLIGYCWFNSARQMGIFSRFINDITEYRKRFNVHKYDVSSALMEIKQNAELADKIDVTDEFINTNNAIIFIAAFETSAITATNILYEVALNRSIQNRLRQEIYNVYAKNNGEITFADVNAMPYLDAVIKETLRKYPINDAIPRKSLSEYKFKGTQVSIPKDQMVVIPVYGIHYDPEIYPKPEVFDPERFLDKETLFRQSMLYIPFGYGPRSCIGERFGVLQIKIAIITILRNYTVDVCEKTFIPYEHSSELIIQQPKDVYLKINKIN